MICLNDLNIDGARMIYERYPQLINNIISRVGRIDVEEIDEFSNAFGLKFVVCLTDTSDYFKILITLKQFINLDNNRQVESNGKVSLFLCEYDIELFREAICTDTISNFLL